jgi:hypothetical protein
MIQQGTKIKIVRAYWTGGLYKNGDVLTVHQQEVLGVLVKFDTAKDYGHGPGLLYIMRHEFEVADAMIRLFTEMKERGPFYTERSGTIRNNNPEVN